MRTVRIRTLARQDIADHYIYLSDQAGSAVAERFLACAEASFRDLAEYPDIAMPLRFRAPELTGARKWRVKDFEKFLIFYLAESGGISVVRVLHAAQDWWRLLDIDR